MEEEKKEGIVEDIEREYLEKHKIKKIFIDEEKVYLKKKSWFGYSIVYPVKTDGKINWKNFIAGGSWIKLGIIAFIILIILGCIMEYSHAVKIANDCLNATNLYSNKVFPITIQ